MEHILKNAFVLQNYRDLLKRHMNPDERILNHRVKRMVEGQRGKKGKRSKERKSSKTTKETDIKESKTETKESTREQHDSSQEQTRNDSGGDSDEEDTNNGISHPILIYIDFSKILVDMKI